jgi:hypothetical protein
MAEGRIANTAPIGATKPNATDGGSSSSKRDVPARHINTNTSKTQLSPATPIVDIHPSIIECGDVISSGAPGTRTDA